MGGTVVIVPAHDEERSISETLTSVLEGADDGVAIVVVCNGCRDATEAIARRFEPAVTVIAIPEASKVAALNVGDRAVQAERRIYLDADVEVGARALHEVVDALEQGALLACPSLELDMSASSPLVRSYHRIWRSLPSVERDAVGRGMYGVSAAGRARWGAFPDLLGDDHFVRSLFAPSEVVVTPAACRVRTPSTARALVARKARVVRGNRLVDRALGSAAHRRPTGWRGVATVVRSSPRRVADLPAYVGITLAARVAARRSTPTWGRDETTRDAPSTAGVGDVV